MGELIAGRPALKLNYVVSAPIDLALTTSLLYRAVAGSGLSPWLVQSRRALSPELRSDLDLLHGFSGRLLYYMEEPIWRFEPLREDRREATVDDLLAFLESLPADDYCEMASRGIQRVRSDVGMPRPAPSAGDEAGWRAFVEPALTTAHIDDVLELLADPERLKARTVGLLRGIWEHTYADQHQLDLPYLREAAERARASSGMGFAPAFAELTGNRVPAALVAGIADVETISFQPSMHLGDFISYTLIPPDLVVFFSAPRYLERTGSADIDQAVNGVAPVEDLVTIGSVENGTVAGDLLDVFRALGDPNRLRVLDLLAEGELYAQEIVGRLGIAQSAVSRHLALLERAGLLRVRPRGGMKYYAVDCERLDAVADALRQRSKLCSGNGT